MDDWADLTVPLTRALAAARDRRAADPAVHVAAELVQAAPAAVEAARHGQRGFGIVLDHVRAAAVAARFGLVAETDRLRLARADAVTTCQRGGQ
ncbi:hypothetical protein ACIGNX_22580 [Actinosynnema sp. NPDC053489]|uniref:hypothetical protein n=1 Tax=Actinosynnema sp. NPDC053489 TaxID=3363916 RepID=UPI0037C91A9F